VVDVADGVGGLTQADTEHLKLLSIFHTVMAIALALFGLFPIIHLLVGLGFLFGVEGLAPSGGEPFPEVLFGVMFTVIPLVIILVMEGLAVAVAVAGARLRARRSWMLCVVVAGLSVMLMPPIGTVLGVFSLIVLNRPAVRQAFAETDALYA